jgi:hypothetical protein
MNLRLGGFAELDEVITFVSGEKVVSVDLVELGVHAVDAPDSLDEASGASGTGTGCAVNGR